MKPSKRVVRDAIRILGYAVQHDLHPSRSLRDVAPIADDAYDLSRSARWSPEAESDVDGTLIDLRAACAAAENLLREGWLP